VSITLRLRPVPVLGTHPGFGLNKCMPPSRLRVEVFLDVLSDAKEGNYAALQDQ
jgi:hypothetical protein